MKWFEGRRKNSKSVTKWIRVHILSIIKIISIGADNMCEWLILLFFLGRCNQGGTMCCDNWRLPRPPFPAPHFDMPDRPR